MAGDRFSHDDASSGIRQIESTIMQIIENWTYLIGIIISILPSPDMPDFYEVHVRIEALKQVESYPILVQGSQGDAIVVFARRSQVKNPDHATGKPFSAHIRAAGPPPLKYYVAPDWPLNE